jgi:hypothetical protein
MARGIGGDDGPSLWMFLACILIWGKIQGWFNAASDKLSGNLANPFQSETTEDIKKKEKQVSGVSYKVSNLPNKLAHYQQIAQAQWDEMHSIGNIDEDKLISTLKPLNKDELIAVFKAFGVKENTVLGVASMTGTIFDFYQKYLTDSTFGGNDLTDMWNVWKKTGLWAKTW